MKHNAMLAVVLMLTVSAAYSQKVPDWVTNIPTPTNGTYTYVVESAFGETELSARNQAIARIFQSTAMRLGQPISSDEINRAVQSGTSYDVISRDYNIPINKVCEYVENKNGTYRVYVLCQIAKSGNQPALFDSYSACYEGANKFYASEALAANGFKVLKNRETQDEYSVRTMMANSKAYSFYDNGMRIYHSEFWNGGHNKASGATLLGATCVGIGLVTAVLGGLSAEEGLDWGSSTAQIGIAAAAVGASILIVRGGVILYGKTQIRKAVDMYNNGVMYSQNGIDMECGLSGNGVFLTFRF